MHLFFAILQIDTDISTYYNCFPSTMTKGRKGKNKINDHLLDNDDSECVVCAKLVTSNNNGIQCDGCTNWYHGPGDETNCSGLSTKVVDALKTANECVKWFCNKCDKRENDLENCMREISLMKYVVKSLQKQNDVILELLKNNIESKSVSNTVINPNVTDSSVDKVKENSSSDFDDEDRKNNVIIYNIAENTDSGNPNNGKDEDVKTITEILKTVKPNFDTTLINKENLERLGKERRNGEKPRPIKLSFTTQFPRHQILKNAYKLKDSKYQKVGISADKNKKERENEIALVKCLKERKTKGEDVVIFNDRIMLREERKKLLNSSSSKEEIDPN